MRNFTILVFLGFLFWGCEQPQVDFVGPAGESQLPQKIGDIQRSIVKVHPERNGQPGAAGSAVFIAANGGRAFFATAYHVVEGASSIQIEPFGRRGSKFSVTVFDDRYDPQTDIAILVTDSSEILSYVDQLSPRWSDDLDYYRSKGFYIAGHPPDGSWVVRKVNINDVSLPYVFLEPGVVEQGFSGGTLANEDDNFYGVIVSSTADGRGRVISTRHILALMDLWGVTWESQTAGDLCKVIEGLERVSFENFDPIKGPFSTDQTSSGSRVVSWQLLDRNFDLTGRGQVSLWMLEPYTRSYYEAKMSFDNDPRVLNDIMGKIDACVPIKDYVTRIGQCQYFSYRRSMWDDPISFLGVSNEDIGVIVTVYRGYQEALPVNMWCK